MTTEDLITRLYGSGGKLVADAQRPRLVIPAKLKPLFIKNKARLMRSILLHDIPRRTEAFRRQLRTWAESGRAGDIVPTLVLPNAPEPKAGLCISCGTKVGPGIWRCDTCRISVLNALAENPQLDG